jgi:hypothetical protein
MEECRQDDERGMDRRQIMGEPPWEVDVGDRATLSPEGGGKLGEGTAESVRREDQALAADHRRRHRRTSIGALRESCIEQVDHARLDREPGQGVDDLDGHEHCPWVPWLPPSPRSTGLWLPRTPWGQQPGRLLRVHHNSPLADASPRAHHPETTGVCDRGDGLSAASLLLPFSARSLIPSSILRSITKVAGSRSR